MFRRRSYRVSLIVGLVFLVANGTASRFHTRRLQPQQPTQQPVLDRRQVSARTTVHHDESDVNENGWTTALANGKHSTHQRHDVSNLPVFAEPVKNVTVVAGRDAVLSCAVDNLHKFKVAWVRVDTHSILTIHNKAITRNYRISLVRADGRHFDLKIANVVESDRGFYMCQINTDPMRYEEAFVDVVVAPDVIDQESSADTVVREGANVSLVCTARGHPPPRIVWRREDGNAIIRTGFNKSRSVNSYEGSVLHLVRVSRLNIGAYLCIASNGIPPSVSKRIMLNVQFAPVLWIPNQLEGTAVGQQTLLVCRIESFPLPIVYWTRDDGAIIVGNSKTVITSTTVENDYKITMSLALKNVTTDTFGGYRCIVRNSLGEVDGLIRVYEVPATRLPANQADTLAGMDDDDYPSPTELYGKDHDTPGDGHRQQADGNRRSPSSPGKTRSPGVLSSSANLSAPSRPASSGLAYLTMASIVINAMALKTWWIR